MPSPEYAPATVKPAPVTIELPAKRAARRTRGPTRKSLPDLDRVTRRLEADWQTALKKHEAAMHRQFLDLRAAVRGRKSLGAKDAEKLSKALAPRLKPKKGRAKDLRRVESALGDALAQLG